MNRNIAEKIVDGADGLAVESKRPDRTTTVLYQKSLCPSLIKQGMGDKYTPVRRLVRGGACKIDGL